LLPDKIANLYLRTSDGQRYTFVCFGVKHLKISDVREGNIVLDIEVRGPDRLEASDIDELYSLSEVDVIGQRTRLLQAARQERLELIVIAQSSGAECKVLLKRWEINAGYGS
jgi:hypothetical protein